jgi:GTP-binding protein HflX
MIEKKNNICLETIDRIGASGIPILTTLNKIDLLEKTEIEEKLKILETKIKNPILISALRKTNLEPVKNVILEKLGDYVRVSFSIPMRNQTMSLMSWLHERADVQKVSYLNDSVQVILEAAPWFAEKVRKRVNDLGGKFETNNKTP